MQLEIKHLIKEIGESPTQLDKDNRKKIHELMPVPTDYHILWANILSFGNYPAGVVICEEGLVLKATKEAVKNINKKIKESNKKVENKDKKRKLEYIYTILPWEYYNPIDFFTEIVELDDGGIQYVIRTDSNILAKYENEKLFEALQKYERKVKNQQKYIDGIIEDATVGAVLTTSSSGTMFNATHAVQLENVRGGFYAEEAGRRLDILYGDRSTVVGGDNAKNGPDKIINGNNVQCKYCKTGSDSVKACFQKNADGITQYRYLNLDDSPMQLEVASDQYEEAVRSMKRRIKLGQVPGVTDQNEAYSIVRKGRITYEQAQNLAKAGSIESLVFDMSTGAVLCLVPFGISFVATFFETLVQTRDLKTAARSAFETGITVYGISFVSSVMASQLARANANALIDSVTGKINEKLSQALAQQINDVARQFAGKEIVDAKELQKSVAKLIGANAVTETILIAVMIAPDTYKLIAGRLSKAQYIKNMTSLGARLLATFAVSAVVTKEVSSALKNQKNGIGQAAGLLAGIVTGIGVNAVWGLYREEDSVITARLFNAVLTNMIIEHLLTEEEITKLVDYLGKDKKNLRKTQEKLISSQKQESDIRVYLLPIIEGIKSERELISIECIENTANSMISDGELAYGM